jgi:3-oxoacyl-[acyl-carrier protein] reductase
MNFKNKSIVICGGSDGIGKSCAELFAAKGGSTTLIARNKEKLMSVINDLDTSKGQVHKHICADFNNPEELDIKINKELSSKTDILINNSGGPRGGLLEKSTLAEFRVSFDRLLLSNQIVTRHAIKRMKKQKYGRIINIISTSIKQVIPGLGVSNTIRGAVAQWGKTLALELGEYGITVNNILPGYTKTDRLSELSTAKAKDLNITKEQIEAMWADSTALKRLAEPKEIANTILFLASEGSSYITGHNLAVDGGRYKT